MQNKNDDLVSTFEKHLQTITALVVMALLTWAGWSLNQLQQNAAAMAVEVRYIKSEVQAVKLQNSEAYTLTQATRDWDRNSADMADLRRRVRELEAKVK